MKYLLIDGPYLAHRSAGVPYQLTTTTNLNATMIHGFLRSLNALYKQFLPNKTIVTWESHGTKSWRQQLQPSYKNEHKPLLPTYIAELSDLQTILHFLHIQQYYSPQNEADDVIATLVYQHQQQTKDNKTDTNLDYIFTVDKDLMQLVGLACYIWNGKELFTHPKVKEKYLVSPNQIPDLLALWGDPSDNIEGIKGYGHKKSAALINKYYSIACIPESEPIYQYHDQYFVNKQLAMLNHDCKLEPIPNKDFITNETIYTLLDKYQLNSIKSKLPEYKRIGAKSWI